jgi:signal transduction histidine kinase
MSEEDRRAYPRFNATPALPQTLRWTRWLPNSLAISLGLTTPEPEHAGLLRAAQIDSIARLTPVAMVASCINGVILVTTLNHMGLLRPSLLVWSVFLFAMACYYARGWLSRTRRDPHRPASARAVRRAILHGLLFGTLWGAVPVIVFAGAPPQIQLLVGCLTAGMMCAGAFVLGTIPIAGLCYVSMVAAGAIYALVHAGSPVDLSLTALMFVYAVVIIVNLTWNAQLFVDHFLAAARLQAETDARERAQTQVAHSQRMAALGQLAGGIAHDFNNLLQAVASSAVSIANRTQDGGQVRRLSARILEAAERGGAISRRLLAFAHEDTLSAEPIDPADLLGSLHELLRPTFDPAIGFRIEAPPGLPRLLADRTQLDTVIVNLTTNARDAMPFGGTLTMRAAREIITRQGADPPLAPGQYVRITIADTGTGMDPETLARATEPFFTTKPKGRGTGLGLSMAKSFAEQSGGALAIESTQGQGTTVTLWLPRTEADAAARPRPPTPFTPIPAARQRNVLLVDDDELVRETMIDSLAPYGCIITVAENARAALDKIDHGDPVDVIVSDYSMPDMNGVDLIAAAQARRPGLAAILLTGHVGEIVTPDPDGGQFTLLRKPVRAADLVRCFVDVLEAAD